MNIMNEFIRQKRLLLIVLLVKLFKRDMSPVTECPKRRNSDGVSSVGIRALLIYS